MNTPIHKDKTYYQLQKDKVRNQILQSTLNNKQYDDTSIFKSLSLLNIPSERQINT